jgi:CO dehydrogenase nickel-insertion accessory protein CooC1
MTKLARAVKREVDIPRMRPVIVTIDPETKTIQLREKGSRTGYEIHIQALYILLVRGGAK